MKLQDVTSKLVHKSSTKSLYRNILRQLNAIDFGIAANISYSSHPEIRGEIVKAKLDKKQYDSNLKTELRIDLRKEFERSIFDKFNRNLILFTRLRQGIDFALSLESVNNENGDGLASILQKIIDYRTSEFKRANMKAQNFYLRRQKRKLHKSLDIDDYDLNNKSSYKACLSEKKIESNSNSIQLLSRYLRGLQRKHLIPISTKLPYTPDPIYRQGSDFVLASKLVEGVLSKSKIMEAYDWEYIESILMPSIEYDINFNQYLQHLREIVEEKGPYKVKIELTEAGPLPIPLIKLPYPRIKELREVALDIKKMLALSRHLTVWDFDESKSRPLTETKNSDGSYTVKDSKGYGEDERMHTKNYYKDLAYGEGLWEYLINSDAKTEFQKEKALKSCIDDWCCVLEENSSVLFQELGNYFDKYKKLKSSSSPLLREQAYLQGKMNHHYDNQVRKFNEVISIMKEENIFKHSEIVNLEHTVSKTYKDYLITEKSQILKRKRRGIPIQERIAMGKSIADVLGDAGLHYFKWGMKLNRRLKV